MGVSPTWVFAAFSVALLIAALLGPIVGRIIDRHGGRDALTLSNLVLFAGLLALASSTGPIGLFASWLVLGVGMALGLYDAAFATLTAHRFWLYALYDERTDEFSEIGKQYGTKPGADGRPEMDRQSARRH